MFEYALENNNMSKGNSACGSQLLEQVPQTPMKVEEYESHEIQLDETEKVTAA